MRTDRKLVIRVVAGVALVAALAAVVAVFAGASQAGAKKTRVNTSVSGSVSFWGIWAAQEQTAFEKVITGFNKQYPNVKVTYTSKGNDMPTVLATAIAGGNPPDVADVAQPGLVKQFVQQHHLKPITYAKKTISKNFAPAWVKLGVVNKKLYALLYKASNKSTLWYNVHSFKQAGVKAPKKWSQLTKAAKTIKSSGTPAYSLCGSSGWTLTDLFENIYLRTFGPAKYNKLSAHKIKWTDSSVTKALTEMKQIVGNSSNLYGGTSGAHQTGYPQCVDYVYSTPPKAAMVIEADFVANEILQATKAKPVTDFNVVPFPAITKGRMRARSRPAATRSSPSATRPPSRRSSSTSPRRRRPRSGRSSAGSAPATSTCRRASTRTRSREDGSAADEGQGGRVRHVRRTARRFRLDHGPGRVGDLPEVPAEPEQHQEHPAATRGIGQSGVQEVVA